MHSIEHTHRIQIIPAYRIDIKNSIQTKYSNSKINKQTNKKTH